MVHVEYSSWAVSWPANQDISYTSQPQAPNEVDLLNGMAQFSDPPSVVLGFTCKFVGTVNPWTLPRATEREALGVDPVIHVLARPPDGVDGVSSMRNWLRLSIWMLTKKNPKPKTTNDDFDLWPNCNLVLSDRNRPSGSCFLWLLLECYEKPRHVISYMLT